MNNKNLIITILGMALIAFLFVLTKNWAALIPMVYTLLMIFLSRSDYKTIRNLFDLGKEQSDFIEGQVKFVKKQQEIINQLTQEKLALEIPSFNAEQKEILKSSDTEEVKNPRISETIAENMDKASNEVHKAVIS